MVRLREIPRTAAFAWSPVTGNPILVTGTRAGAVDADFSDETKLELWDLNLDNLDQGLELHPVVTINTDARFYDIAWGPPNADHPRGIIVGATESGSLDLWDAEKLLSGKEDALLSRTTKHSGAIKSLQFNPLRPQVLATAGAKGEVFIWDVHDISTPFRLGTAAARSDDIECVAWNRKVANILATGGAGGFVTVWDLKTKKASLTLNNNRKPVSAIEWDPNNSTKLLTATPDDNNPVIYLWDLRNSNAPERAIEGHEQGVLSLSWCQHDSELLLSCGKDNRTLIWNPHTGERYGEFPEVTNWTFSTRFNPGHPFLSATASFDGKITVQTLQNTNWSASPAAQSNLNDEEFFTKAQTQLQSASFTLPKAPAWSLRPVGASFGYGGKLVSFSKKTAAAGQAKSSVVRISQITLDSDIRSASEQFEEAVKTGDIAGICTSHLEKASTEEERAEWQIMQVLSEADGRTKIIEYLGFSKDEVTNEVAKGTVDEVPEQAQEAEGNSDVQPNGQEKKHRRVTSLWGDGEDGDDFLSNLAAHKGAKIDNPFHLFSEGNTSLDDKVSKALIMGNFEKAADICIRENRMADALIIANCGGKELLDKVQETYLAQKDGSPSYLRLLASVVAKNLWDIVYNADLSNWKESMVIFCTFADPSEFPNLCEGLGDRIADSGSRKDASFCYLVGSKLEKVVTIWIAELEEAERAGTEEPSDDSTFSVHARSLQQFIEKVTVFREVTKFADSEQSLASGWKLASLYDKYTEYADIVAAQGLLSVAQKYLDLLPTNYPAAEVARNRIKQATQTAQPQQTLPSRSAASSSRAVPRTNAPVAYQQPSAAPTVGNSLNAYPSPAQPSATTAGSYGRPTGAPYQPTAPSAYAPPSSTYAPPAPISSYAGPGGYGQPATYGTPPRNPAPAPTPPPPRAREAGQWNDVPMVTKPPVRKTTPSVAPITSPFPGQNPLASPPTANSYQRGTATPPPPPPKASAPPRSTNSPLVAPRQVGSSPAPAASAAPNPYAPPASGPPPVTGQTMPRTASPYNAPPPGMPPSNRYAPAPAQQQYGQAPAVSPLGPPPAASRPPPSNPYAMAPAGAGAPGPYAPSYQDQLPQAGRPPVGPPPRGSYAVGPPATGPPASSGPPPAARPAPPAAAPSTARHPPGDRSHIPEPAKPVVDMLSQDMQRVAAKAPASFAPQVRDTQKRLGLLFDHLNNQELVQPDTISQLYQLAEALVAKNYNVASRLQVEIQRDKTEECGNWMVGVKRLISMSRATP